MLNECVHLNFHTVNLWVGRIKVCFLFLTCSDNRIKMGLTGALELMCALETPDRLNGPWLPNSAHVGTNIPSLTTAKMTDTCCKGILNDHAAYSKQVRKIKAFIWRAVPAEYFGNCCFSVRPCVFGLHCEIHTHKHMHLFAAQILKNRFFSMTQCLFSCTRRKKNTPSPTFTWGNRAIRDRSADQIRDEDYLNCTRGKLMVSSCCKSM